MTLDIPDGGDEKVKKIKKTKTEIFRYGNVTSGWNRPPNNMMISFIPWELEIKICTYTLQQLWKVKKFLDSDEWKKIPKEVLVKLINEVVKRESIILIGAGAHRTHLYEVYDKEKK